MPNLDGIEMLKKLKSNDSTAAIPIIMLTAKQSDADLLEGLTAGADDYIKKPFTMNVLKIRIQNLLK
jgi:DNA-binding response OmpR family regulator